MKVSKIFKSSMVEGWCSADYGGKEEETMSHVRICLVTSLVAIQLSSYIYIFCVKRMLR